MNLKYKSEILVAVFLVILVASFYYLFAILLPFLIGLLLAFSCLPIIKMIQKLVKIRALATSLFLASSIGITVLFVVLLGNYVNKDFKRLENSFQVLKSQNKDKLDIVESKIKEYVGKFYDIDKLESTITLTTDSLNQNAVADSFSGIDTKAIEDSFTKTTGSLGSSSANTETKKPGVSSWSIIIMSISYFVLILYNIEYFESVRKRYMGAKLTSGFNTIMSDFNRSFVKYFALRTKIVLLLSIIYLPAFIFLNLPGGILFTLLIILLTFIPYLQYIVLIPISVACLTLSTEGNYGFLFYYGIVVGVFILASIIEEFVLNPFIMEKNIGINPVIMVLSISVWTFILGFPGVLIGIPLTSFCIIYIKRHFIEPMMKINGRNN